MKEDEEKMINKEEVIKKPNVIFASDETVKKAALKQFNKNRETFRKLAKR